jgi:rhamnosyl/mannosyltransferase
MLIEQTVNLRILHIGKYFPPNFGGIETFMSQLMLEQQKLGLIVSGVIHCKKRQFTKVEHVWHGCKLYCVNTYGQFAYAPIAPAFPMVLLKALKHERPDIVHIHMPNLSAYWLLVLSLFTKKNQKWVVHWHSDVLGTIPDLKVKLLYPIYCIFERWLLKKADAVICTSPNYLESSKPLTSYRHKCFVIPLGISIPEGTQKPSISKSHDDKTLRLICIGRLTYYKGHALLFEAIKQLTLLGKNIILDVVGEGELKNQLQAMAKDKGLERCIHFHGGVSEAEKYRLLNHANMLCLPSIERTEAFGVVILEAAAMAKPALVSDVEGSGMSFVVKERETGLVVKANSVESLRKQLLWAQQNLDHLQLFGGAACLRFNDIFSMESASRKISSVYIGDKIEPAV